MLRIGHRGACGYELENTLASFRKAMDLGVDMIELDVRKTKDGKIVVIHDDTLQRTTDGKGKVAQKTLEEIRSLNTGNGEKIPTLEEVLDLVGGRVQINIELKVKGTAEGVARIIESCVKGKKWKTEDFLVSSSVFSELSAFKVLLPQIRLGAIIRNRWNKYEKFGQKTGIYSVHPAKKVAGKRFVEKSHRNDWKVFVWTVNGEKDIKKIKQMGADGIFSDFPDRI